MLIRGYLRDCQGKSPRPKLDLYFHKAYRSSLPQGEKVQVVLDLNGVEWAGTMNSTHATHPPYVHTNMARAGGISRSCTDVFLELGLKDKAELDFEFTKPDRFQLVRIINKGEWRPGRAPHERSAGNIGHERSSAVAAEPPRTADRASDSIRREMSDPLDGFVWTTLYERYDRACKRFDPQSAHLTGVSPTAATDRRLYDWLVQTAALNNGKRPLLGGGWYEAMLYWKLYSSTPDNKLTEWLREFKAASLHQLLAAMPVAVKKDVDQVLGLVKLIGTYPLPGMKSLDALPVRTTFLHFLYPRVVPIFDRMVLKAVGTWFEGANKKTAVLRRYLPHVWVLAERHTMTLSGFQESPVRLIDMALWVGRGTH